MKTINTYLNPLLKRIHLPPFKHILSEQGEIIWDVLSVRNWVIGKELFMNSKDSSFNFWFFSSPLAHLQLGLSLKDGPTKDDSPLSTIEKVFPNTGSILHPWEHFVMELTGHLPNPILMNVIPRDSSNWINIKE